MTFSRIKRRGQKFPVTTIFAILFAILLTSGRIALAVDPPDPFDAWKKLEDPIRSKSYDVYDRYSCNGLPEDEWPIKGTIQKNIVIPPAHIKTSPTSVELVWDIPTFSDLMGQVMGLNTVSQAPQSIISVTPQDPRPNEPVRLTADGRYFKSQLASLQTIWCIDGKSAMGLAAGGDMGQEKAGPTTRIEATEYIIIDKGAINSGDAKDIVPISKTYDAPCCDQVKRNFDATRDDEDDDGLSDVWERRYFANLQQSAQSDPDNDGSPERRFTNNQKSYDRAEGRSGDDPMYRFTPNIQTTSRSGRTISGDSYDSVFTNVEEFVWGTNPTDPDTDDDGFPDGADIIGIGQSQISYTTPNLPLSQQKEFTIHQTTVGDVDSTDEWLTSLTKFATDERIMTIRRGLPMDVRLENLTPTAEASTVGSGGVLRIQAYPSSGINADPVALFYQWGGLFPVSDGSGKQMRRVMIDAEPVRGKHILVTNIQELRQKVLTETGQDLVQEGAPFDIEVEVFANRAKEVARNRITVTLYRDVTIEVSDQQCQKKKENILETTVVVNLDLCLGENASPAYHLVALPSTEGYTVGGTGDKDFPTLATVSATPVLEFTAANPYRESDFTYVWRVDGTRATQATHPLVLFVTKKPGDTIEIEVDIYRKSDRLLIVKSRVKLTVVSPEIFISPEEQSDPETSTLTQGQKVKYRIDVNHPGSTPSSYTWFLNGKEVAQGDSFMYEAKNPGTDILSVRSEQGGALVPTYQQIAIQVESVGGPLESSRKFLARISSGMGSLSRITALFSLSVLACMGLILFVSRANKGKAS